MTEPDSLDATIALVAQTVPDLLAAWIFGSRATGEARVGSDLDVALLFPRDVLPPPGIEEQVAAAIAVQTLLDVDVCRLTEQAPVLAMEIVSHGRRVFDRNHELVDEIEESIRRRYLDTAHLRRVQNHYLFDAPL